MAIRLRLRLPPALQVQRRHSLPCIHAAHMQETRPLGITAFFITSQQELPQGSRLGGGRTGKGRSLPRTFVKPAAAPAAEKPASKAPAEKAPRKAPANVRLQPHDAMVGAYHRSMEAARTTSVVPSSGSPPLFSCGVSRAATHTLPIDCISLIDRRPWVRPVRRTSSTSA